MGAEDVVQHKSDEGRSFSWHVCGPLTATYQLPEYTLLTDLFAISDPAPGIPVTASAVYSYHIDSDIGAILLTRAPVTHERYYHSTPFKDWMKDNAHIILDRWRYEAKEFGMWIVTSTFSTRKCAINMWTTRKRGVKVGFSADIAGVGKIGPGIDWYRSHTDEGWGEYTSEVCGLSLK